MTHGHRDVRVDRRLDRRGVQHLRAERGELGRLREADLGDRGRLGHVARVAREDALDVRPDLDLLRPERGAEERGGVVAPPAP